MSADNTKRICFYHRIDLDGWCSAAQVFHWHEDRGLDIELYGINYGDRFPMDTIGEDTEVWMVDFSLQPIGKMFELKDRCKRLIWIDHHSSAIDAYEEVNCYIDDAVLNVEFAACELVYFYLNPSGDVLEDRFIPEAIWLLGRYDCWKWKNSKREKDIINFQQGMRNKRWVRNPRHKNWRKLLQHEGIKASVELIDAAMAEGKQRLEFRDEDWGKYAHSHAFETYLPVAPCSDEKVRAVAVNRGAVNSEFFNPLEHRFPNAKIGIVFVWRNSQFMIGLYRADWMSDEVDCGKIARAHGGGGHPGAAGFQVESWDQLPFPLL